MLFRLLGIHFSSVQSISRVRLFATPWTTVRPASLSISNSWSSPKPISIEFIILIYLLIDWIWLLSTLFPVEGVSVTWGSISVRTSAWDAGSLHTSWVSPVPPVGLTGCPLPAEHLLTFEIQHLHQAMFECLWLYP